MIAQNCSLNEIFPPTSSMIKNLQIKDVNNDAIRLTFWSVMSLKSLDVLVLPLYDALLT